MFSGLFFVIIEAVTLKKILSVSLKFVSLSSVRIPEWPNSIYKRRLYPIYYSSSSSIIASDHSVSICHNYRNGAHTIFVLVAPVNNLTCFSPDIRTCILSSKNIILPDLVFIDRHLYINVRCRRTYVLKLYGNCFWTIKCLNITSARSDLGYEHGHVMNSNCIVAASSTSTYVTNRSLRY